MTSKVEINATVTYRRKIATVKIYSADLNGWFTFTFPEKTGYGDGAYKILAKREIEDPKWIEATRGAVQANLQAMRDCINLIAESSNDKPIWMDEEQAEDLRQHGIEPHLWEEANYGGDGSIID